MPKWYYIALGLLLLTAIALYPFQGWITYIFNQRRHESLFSTVHPKHHPEPRQWPDDRITLSWLGHATMLINFYGKWILTDPVLGESIGLHLFDLLSFGPRRLVHCPLRADELPPLDLVLISHAHMDHLDTKSLRQLKHGIQVVTAKDTLDCLPPMPARELHWGESIELNGVCVTAIEINHWGARLPYGRQRGFNAYLLERNGHAILFVGDTAYTDSLQRACAGRNVDVAILPIGGYKPYIRSHASPEQTWKMCTDIKARYLAPIHHSTFVLSHEHPTEPLEKLLAAAGTQTNQVILRQIGETFTP
ncbi:MAG: MBL fold metallo-hydrolase [Verrucomicrobia bacterium]|nr:MBL fold metallo-hydrolase [Verrucomicrobiota bacterium]